MSYLDGDQILRLRCAYYTYLENVDRFLDEDERTMQAIERLQPTMEEYCNGRLNFATVKYRMDNAFPESDGAFPPRAVLQTLSDLALSLKVDDLEQAMHKAIPLPDGLEEGKGTMLDLETFFERQIAQGRLKEEQLIRIPRLMACFWHIQDPMAWPPLLDATRSYLIKIEAFEPLDLIQDYIDGAAASIEIKEAVGLNFYELDHVCSLLLEGELEVPSEEECFTRAMEQAKTLDGAGQTDAAIAAYERALALRPDTPEAMLRSGELYASKGQLMMAIAEIESLVELKPKSLSAHKKLLSLYHDAKQVKDYNIEVRRFKQLMQGE